MKYTMIQQVTGQIIIIDESTSFGERRIYKETNEGGVIIGTIESDMKPYHLKCGFEHDIKEEGREELTDLKCRIAAAVRTLNG